MADLTSLLPGTQTPRDTSTGNPAAVDPLLMCLAMTTKLLDKPIHVQVLRTGFALDAVGRVPLAAYPDLAQKHGLMAAWSRIKVSEIPTYVLPVLLPLMDGRACVLRDFEGEDAIVLWADLGMENQRISIAELQSLSRPEVLAVKLAPKRHDQTLAPMHEKAFSWFWDTLWRFRHFYVESMIATLVANILTLASVFFTMNVYDRVVPTQAYSSLWTLAIGTTIAIVMEFVMRWLKARLVDLGGKKADLAINATLLREIMSIRLEHRPQSVGIFASSMRDFESLRDFFSSSSLVLLADMPFVLMYLLLIALVAGPLALVPAAVVPILLLIGLYAQKPLIKAMRENMKEAGDKQSVLVESVLNRRAARLGTARIRHELQSRGLAPEMVAGVVADLRDSELARAREVWRKKFGEPAQDAGSRAKQMRFLAGRGFSAEVIRRVVTEPDQEPDAPGGDD